MFEDGFTPGQVYAAVGEQLAITRNESRVWQQRGLISIPPLNPGMGSARKHSLAGAFEFALFKALVGWGEVNISHLRAADVLRTRLDTALALRGFEPGDYAALNDPDALLHTEFDAATHGRGRVYWFISTEADRAAAVMSNWVPFEDPVSAEPEDVAQIVDPAFVLAEQHAGKAAVIEVTAILHQVGKALTGSRTPLHEDAGGWTGR